MTFVPPPFTVVTEILQVIYENVDCDLTHGFIIHDFNKQRGEFGGIWAKLNINVEIVVANFVFSQIAVGTYYMRVQ